MTIIAAAPQLDSCQNNIPETLHKKETSVMSLRETFLSIQLALGKPYQDLEFLLRSLKAVLIKNGEKEIAEDIPWISDKDMEVERLSPKHVQLYSLIFHVNLIPCYY